MDSQQDKMEQPLEKDFEQKEPAELLAEIETANPVTLKEKPETANPVTLKEKPAQSTACSHLTTQGNRQQWPFDRDTDDHSTEQEDYPDHSTAIILKLLDKKLLHGRHIRPIELQAINTVLSALDHAVSMLQAQKMVKQDQYKLSVKNPADGGSWAVAFLDTSFMMVLYGPLSGVACNRSTIWTVRSGMIGRSRIIGSIGNYITPSNKENHSCLWIDENMTPGRAKIKKKEILLYGLQMKSLTQRDNDKIIQFCDETDPDDESLFALYTKFTNGTTVYIRPLPSCADVCGITLPENQPRSNIVYGMVIPDDLDVGPKYVWKKDPVKRTHY